jgi:hypothetical protein
MIYEKELFSKQECDDIISLVKSDSRSWSYLDRSYDSYLISYDNTTNWIFDKLKIFFEEQTGIPINELKREIHFHKFQSNDYFGIHNDARDNRLYSVGVLLNDSFGGGDFVLYPNNTVVYLNKKIGNAYIFPVNIEHEITKITNGNRYSLIWFLQNSNIKLNIKSII